MKKESLISRIGAIVETQELLLNKLLMDDLRKGMAEAKEGKTIPWEKAKHLLRIGMRGW